MEYAANVMSSLISAMPTYQEIHLVRIPMASLFPQPLEDQGGLRVPPALQSKLQEMPRYRHGMNYACYLVTRIASLLSNDVHRPLPVCDLVPDQGQLVPDDLTSPLILPVVPES